MNPVKERPLACLAQVLAFLVVATSLAGCASRRAAREIAGAEYRIRSVHIEGNAALEDDAIKEHLYLRPTKWFPLPQRRYYFEGYLPIDMDRIEQVYAARGYHDARVVDAQVHPVKDRKVVDLVFFVEEGLPTNLTDVRFEWPEGKPREGTTAQDVEAKSNLKVGEAFDVERMQQAESTMKAALLAKGFAFAESQGTAEVNRASRQAQVRFVLKPGPRVKIGEIRIKGLQNVPEKPLRTEIETYQGKPYSPNRIHAIEQAIYATGVFSSVAAQLDERPRGEFVDLTLTVTEGNPQQIKLGFGLGFEPARWEQYISAIYSHENLFNTLTHFDVRVKAGYAELPRLIDVENYRPVSGVHEHGPIFEVRPRVRKKGLLEKKLIWEWAPAFELGLQQGYQYYSPSNRVGVSRFFTRFIETNVSHNVRFFDYFNRDPSFDRQQSLLGLDYRDPYLLSYVEFGLWFHITDQVLNPTQGVVFGAIYDIAGGIFGGDYDYNKIMPEVRGYWTPLRNRLQFALRAQLGFILPFGDEPGAPFANKFYLGGASTVRGWGLRRLSPYLNNCDGEPPGCLPIPIGGNSMVMGNFETRLRVWRELWVVAFVDMGDVQPGVSQVRPSQWNYAAGPGVRYKSPVGTFRLDVGFRLNETERFDSQARWAVHFGLGEAF